MKMRFTLAFLLSAFVLVALSLAVFGPFGVVVGPFLVAIVAHVRTGAWKRSGCGNVALFLIGIVFMSALLLPFLAHVREVARRTHCVNNLKQIGLALHNYRDSYGVLPPVRECDFSGKPLCSWLVAILPYLSEGNLFQQFNRSEPWNGPNNGKLANKMPGVYQCPTDAVHQGTTSYVAVVGSDGAWLEPPPNTEDKPNPVLVVETCNMGMCWTEPRDISLEEICKAASESSTSGLSSNHVIEGDFFYYDQPAGANAVFADGTVRRIPPEVPVDMLRAALLGDRQKQEKLEGVARAARKVKWANCASLAGLVVWFVLMLAWPRSTRDGGGGANSAQPPAEPGAEGA